VFALAKRALVHHAQFIMGHQESRRVQQLVRLFHLLAPIFENPELA